MKKTRWAFGATAFVVLALLSPTALGGPLETADSLLRTGSADQALEILQKALTDHGWQTEVGKITTANTFLKVADIFHDQQRFDASLSSADSGLAHLGRATASDPELEVALYEVKGKALRRLRRPEEACLALEQAVAGHRRVSAGDPPRLARTLNYLALAQREAGDLEASTTTATQAIAVSESAGQSEDARTAQYYNTLARGRQSQARYEEAATLFEKALALAIPSLGENHPHLTALYNNLGNVNSDMGRFDDALSNYSKALAIREEQMGPNDTKVAEALSNVALVYHNTGQYAKAESRYRRASDIFRTKLGPRHEYVGAMAMNLGALYLDQRRFGDAEEVLLEGKAIFEQIDPDGHPQMAGILNNLAIVARSTDRDEEAQAYLVEALRLKTARYGESSPELASTLNSLGVLAFSREDWTISSEYLERALEIERAVYGDRHPEVATRLLNLGELRSRQGDLVAADSLFEQATAIWTTVYGENNLWLAEAWERRAVSLRNRGNHTAAWALLQQVHRIRLDHFRKNAHVLSEPDALAYSTFLRHTTDLLLSHWLDLGSTPGRDSIAAQAVLSCKGTVWDELMQRTGAWQKSADSGSIALAEQIRSTRWQLARAYVAGPSEDQSTFRERLDSLADQIEEYESALAERNFEYRKLRETTSPTVAAVAKQLPTGTVLLDFVRYQYWPTDATSPVPHYLAVVMQRKNLEVVSLGPAEPIDSQLHALRQHLQAVAELGAPIPGDLEAYRDIARELYAMLLAPLDGRIPPDAALLLAPEGPLCLLAWAGLMPDSTSYLIERHDIAYVGSGRDLLQTATAISDGRGLLAVGDVDFDAASTSVPLPGGSRSTATIGAPVAALQGTLTEVTEIAAVWTRSHAEPVELLLGAAATEAAFKSKAPHYRFLHIATHGFYTNPKPVVESYALLDFAFERRASDNPLLRSGLYFAAVNTRDAASDSSVDDDGVLTALEVSALPLSGTDVVVLSACETGLGAVLEGEGVSGLRRAFHLAGVQTVVSALWPISDDRTAELMHNLYVEIESPMGQRLVKYQRELLASLRLAGESDHPYFWAPFIAVSRY